MNKEKTIERLCRIICEAEGVDPDRESIGCGGVIERDKPYKLWDARRHVAVALVNAGVQLPSEDNAPEGSSGGSND